MEETLSDMELEEQVAQLLKQNSELKKLLVESTTTGSNILLHNSQLKQQLLQLQNEYAENRRLVSHNLETREFRSGPC